MASTREVAFLGGIGLSVCGSILLSLRPGSVALGVVILVPGLVLFLWGLLSTPNQRD